jgi:ParB/RepB/Spo0J family partition protein
VGIQPESSANRRRAKRNKALFGGIIMNKWKTLGDLEWINPFFIKPSEENPRDKDFYKDKDFLRLKESVAKYGVIVPIIAKKLPEEEDSKKYRLVDGERRWKAAIDTNQEKIPAYILPPEREINVLTTMFQIHMNQEEWDAIEQARALEGIIISLKQDIKQKMGVRNEDKIEEALVKELIEITGMDKSTAWSRIRFFRWPKETREYIYNEPNKSYYSYAVEMEEKIVEPALRNFPDITQKLPPDEMRKALFAKATGGYVGRADEIREASILSKRRTTKKEVHKAKNLLLQFIKDQSFTFPEAREQYLYLFPEEAQKPPLSPRKLINTIRTLIKALNEYTEATIKKLKATQKRDLESALNELISIAQRVTRKLKQ